MRRLAAACLMAYCALVMGADPAPLAISGYDPVAYFTVGRPVQGLANIEHESEGHLYRFSSVEHRELFKQDPARYTPQFNSYCAMALTRGELIEPDPQSWMISEGKLYFFGAPEGPGRFMRDLQGNLHKANENRWLTEKQRPH